MAPERDLEQLVADTIRILSADMVQKANSGHPGMPMGMADAAFTLWAKFLKHCPSRPDWPDRDRFVLSAGHGSALLYSLLHLFGYDLSMEDLKNFRQWGSPTAGHPEYGAAPGIETTTGPLGQGLSNAVGMALAERMLAARFNTEKFRLFDHRTYVIASDGDMMEGVASEAASLTGHLGLNRLIVLYDDNKITIEGKTELAFSEDVGARFEAYGWRVLKADAHDRSELAAALEKAKAETEKPVFIVCRSHIGFGSPNKQDTPDVHGAPLGEEELKLVKERCGFPPEESFYVPPEVKDFLAEAAKKGEEAYAEWARLLEAYKKEEPGKAAEPGAAAEKEGIKELIIATNPSVEGDTTTLYIARMFRGSDVRVTRPARGLPLGSSLEFVDRGTISRALEGREEVD